MNLQTIIEYCIAFIIGVVVGKIWTLWQLSQMKNEATKIIISKRKKK